MEFVSPTKGIHLHFRPRTVWYRFVERKRPLSGQLRPFPVYPTLGERQTSIHETRIKLTVVIPVFNSKEQLCRCLNALNASTRSPDQIIVVDDSSADDSATVARDQGACVVPVTDGPRGPAVARNRGAVRATGDALVFLDADVTVHPDTLALFEKYLIEQPNIAAFFGSYDALPAGRGVVSRYKNLMHHYVHQHARREAFTFWAGCGAIRRQVFEALGGFDERYARPSIEDIALGARLRQAGHRVWLCPDIQVTHLKEWTLGGLLLSDIRDRAIPWSRLLFRQGALPADLNLDANSRLSALVAWLGLLALPAGFWMPWVWALVPISIAILLLLNIDLYRFFARHGETFFIMGAISLHIFYLFYSSAVFAVLFGVYTVAKLFKCQD